jgi:hypothetical protein
VTQQKPKGRNERNKQMYAASTKSYSQKFCHCTNINRDQIPDSNMKEALSAQLSHLENISDHLILLQNIDTLLNLDLRSECGEMNISFYLQQFDMAFCNIERVQRNNQTNSVLHFCHDSWTYNNRNFRSMKFLNK